MRSTSSAVLLGATALILGACGGAAESDESVREDGTVVEGGDVGALQLQVGDCFDDAAEGAVESLPVVPCNDAHTGEIYFAFDLPDGDFPGVSETRDASEMACLDAFEGFIGAPYATSVWDIGTLKPSVDTWEQLDDREVICYTYRVDNEPSTGSAEGVGE